MTRAKYQRPIVDGAGNLIPNVYAEVRKETPGLPKAILYNADGVLQSNPIGPFADGVVEFYTAGQLNGLRVHVYAAGYDETFENEPCGTGGQVDADTLLGAAFNMEFETATASPPSAGAIRANNADLSAATALHISETNAAGSSIAARLAELVEGDRISITASDGTQVSWNVDSGGVTDNGSDVSVAITGHSGETSLSAAAVGMKLDRRGATGVTGSMTALTQAEYDALSPPNAATLYVITD